MTEASGPSNPMAKAPPPAGLIDLHSHILPGIDDGCADLDETLASIAQLQAHGYSASFCTPHHWPQAFPHIIPPHITIWLDQLNEDLHAAGVEYMLYPGGELRLFPGVIEWCEQNGVPTLGPSRWVLIDFWEKKWRKWIDQSLDWLQAQGYGIIWAHPERSVTAKHFDKHLTDMQSRGVLLQTNLSSLTGANGPIAEDIGSGLLQDGRLTFLALDMHRPEALEERLEGLAVARELVGDELTAALTDTNIRRLIFQP